MPKYMLTPIESLDDKGETFDDLALARKTAFDRTQMMTGAQGFAVMEVREIGRYERVSPIWTEPCVPIGPPKSEPLVKGDVDIDGMANTFKTRSV